MISISRSSKNRIIDRRPCLATNNLVVGEITPYLINFESPNAIISSYQLFKSFPEKTVSFSNLIIIIVKIQSQDPRTQFRKYFDMIVSLRWKPDPDKYIILLLGIQKSIAPHLLNGQTILKCTLFAQDQKNIMLQLTEWFRGECQIGQTLNLSIKRTKNPDYISNKSNTYGLQIKISDNYVLQEVADGTPITLQLVGLSLDNILIA
ncbi:UNKNOWN [Stylonychia lemnae]|uniref:Uncharacterized protein n=1 Tax=Stylonychia lemnae TaxID=5949 RepID=A0A078ABL6_STYLE|nr:UNKNOWN [Stylonychia lemnae]|eukprot:CDW79690.1 UNKNOWN [Stylonychia lemnae]